MYTSVDNNSQIARKSLVLQTRGFHTARRGVPCPTNRPKNFIWDSKDETKKWWDFNGRSTTITSKVRSNKLLCNMSILFKVSLLNKHFVTIINNFLWVWLNQLRISSHSQFWIKLQFIEFMLSKFSVKTNITHHNSIIGYFIETWI